MCALELDVSQLHAMASITVAPLAFAARLAGTRLDSRRPRVVRARVPAKSRLVTQSVLKVDDSLNEDAPEDSKSPAVLAAAAVATAIVLAASPAHGAEARPAVDVGAHDYYLETMEASGLRPARIEAKSAPATGLNRFGSAATAADETASLVSTAFAVGLAAVLGVSGNNRKGPGASGGKRPGWKKSNNARVATPKSNIVKTSAFGKKPFRKTAGTAYVPSYKGFVGSSSSSRGGKERAGSGAGSDGAGSGPAPAMRAAAALGATVVLGGLSTAGPAVLEAEGAAVAAAATSAVLLGTAASAATQTKKKTDVRSNIITFKTAVAPATKTRTEVITRPAKPPGGGAKKTKPRWSPGDAPKDTASATREPAAALLAVVGLGALLLAGSTTTADGPSRKSASSAKRGAKPSAAATPRRAGGFKAPTFEAPAVELPAIPAMDFNKGVFESLEVKVPEMKVSLPALDTETPAATLAGAAALLSAAAALARVGLGKLGSLSGAGPAAHDPAAVARSVADAQVWVDAWQRSILYPENPEHVFESQWDRNAPTPEKAAEASTYAAEAAQSRRPRPFSRADVARRTGDAQAWIDAWAAKTHARSEEALRGWETGRIIGAWNKGLVQELDSSDLDSSPDLDSPAAAEPRSAVAARVKQAQTWINAWQKTLKASATRKKATLKKTKNTTTATDKQTKTKTKKKGSRRAYYETIAGVKYDKAVLEECRGFAARDGAVDLAAAKSTWALIADGAVKKQTRADGRVVKSSVTNVELATALYALETFAWADDAQAWFQERVEGVDAK